MKKIFLLVAAIAFGSITFAKPVDVNTAKTFAATFLAKQFAQQGMNTTFQLELANPVSLNSKPLPMYVFNVSGANGFVIVAADDIVTPILAYSTESNFNLADSKSNAQYYIRKYTRQINYAIENNIAASSETIYRWNNGGSKSKAKTGHSVAPMLTTCWDQGPNYNSLCPYDAAAHNAIGNNYCPTGCVATAMAQVLRFWKYPAHGYSSHTYSAWNYGPQTFDFKDFTFRWNAMPNISTSKISPIDTLMYACGVALDMGYGPAGSGACVLSSDCSGGGAEYALKHYFLYDANLKGYKENANDSIWIGMLENELNNGRPIIYAGADTASQEGHCFDFDGYDVNDMFHINWGWNCSDNAYYTVHNLIPSQGGQAGGIGAGNGNYGADEEAILGVAPPPTIQIANAISPASQVVSNGEPFSFSTNLKNLGSFDFNGFLSAIITDNNGGFVGIVDINQNKFHGDTVGIAKNTMLNQDTLFSTQGLYGIPNGTYNVSIYNQTIGFPTWNLVTNSGTFTNSAQITFTGATGISNVIKDGDVSMFPNPANGVLKIQNTSRFIVEKVMVLNMQGQVILESTPSNNRSFSVDLNAINDGIYLVKIATKDGGEVNKKLVIQK